MGVAVKARRGTTRGGIASRSKAFGSGYKKPSQRMASGVDPYGPQFQRLKSAVLVEADYCCNGCGIQARPGSDNAFKYVLSVDHIIGVARGGKTVKSNLQVLCHLCHARKIGKSNRRARNLILDQASRIVLKRRRSKSGMEMP